MSFEIIGDTTIDLHPNRHLFELKQTVALTQQVGEAPVGSHVTITGRGTYFYDNHTVKWYQVFINDIDYYLAESMLTIPPTTAQGIFNTVKTHLLTQGVKSIKESRVCQYRMPDGRKCAAGVLITDEEYSPVMEGQLFITLLNSGEWRSLERFEPHRELINELQSVHDNHTPVEWEYALQCVALKFDLTFGS